MLNTKHCFILMRRFFASVFQANLKQSNSLSQAHLCKVSGLSRADWSPASKQQPRNCKGIRLQDSCYTGFIVLPIFTSSFCFTQKPLTRLVGGQKGSVGHAGDRESWPGHRVRFWWEKNYSQWGYLNTHISNQLFEDRRASWHIQ